MSLMTGIVNANQALAAEDLEGDVFKVVAGKVQLNIDPTSNITAVPSATGLKLTAPTAPAPTNTLTYDAIGKTITSTVSGVVATTSLASLDDEGVSLSFAAGSLQLKNSAGTVLSTTPVPDLDAQTLTLTGQTLAISGGNSVTLPAPPATTNVLTISAAGVVTSTVDGVVATANLPAPAPTTHVNAWTKAGGLTESVNSVASNIAIPAGTVTDLLGYNAAGAPVYTPIVKPIRIVETYGSTAVSAIVSIVGPDNTNPLFTDYKVDTLVEFTGPGLTLTLPTPPAAISQAMIGVEIDLKLTGTWTGTASIAAAATIDGAASYSFTKAAATGVNSQPSRSVRWTGSKWLIV